MQEYLKPSDMTPILHVFFTVLYLVTMEFTKSTEEICSRKTYRFLQTQNLNSQTQKKSVTSIISLSV